MGHIASRPLGLQSQPETKQVIWKPGSGVAETDGRSTRFSIQVRGSRSQGHQKSAKPPSALARGLGCVGLQGAAEGWSYLHASWGSSVLGTSPLPLAQPTSLSPSPVSGSLAQCSFLSGKWPLGGGRGWGDAPLSSTAKEWKNNSGSVCALPWGLQPISTSRGEFSQLKTHVHLSMQITAPKHMLSGTAMADVPEYTRTCARTHTHAHTLARLTETKFHLHSHTEEQNHPAFHSLYP